MDYGAMIACICICLAIYFNAREEVRRLAAEKEKRAAYVEGWNAGVEKKQEDREPGPEGVLAHHWVVHPERWKKEAAIQAIYAICKEAERLSGRGATLNQIYEVLYALEFVYFGRVGEELFGDVYRYTHGQAIFRWWKAAGKIVEITPVGQFAQIFLGKLLWEDMDKDKALESVYGPPCPYLVAEGARVMVRKGGESPGSHLLLPEVQDLLVDLVAEAVGNRSLFPRDLEPNGVSGLKEGWK